MQVIVVGCGRSGTNMALEMLRGNSYFLASMPEEDKGVFKRKEKLGFRYLTKCDTVYFDVKQFQATMDRNRDLSVIWTIRDPRDMILSKIYRGQVIEKGGDCTTPADDSTPAGAVKDIQRMFEMYQQVQSDRVMLAKMEFIIDDPTWMAKLMCRYLGIPYERGMEKFWQRMRNVMKSRRYQGLDKSQVGLWKNMDTAFGGFFAGRQKEMKELFEKVGEVINYYGY